MADKTIDQHRDSIKEFMGELKTEAMKYNAGREITPADTQSLNRIAEAMGWVLMNRNPNQDRAQFIEGLNDLLKATTGTSYQVITSVAVANAEESWRGIKEASPILSLGGTETGFIDPKAAVSQMSADFTLGWMTCYAYREGLTPTDEPQVGWSGDSPIDKAEAESALAGATAGSPGDHEPTEVRDEDTDDDAKAKEKDRKAAKSE